MKTKTGEIMTQKYLNKHISVAISLKDILKEKALCKSFDCLDRKDFQNWFVKFWWNKTRGIDGMDEYGEPMSQKEMHEFTAAMFR